MSGICAIWINDSAARPAHAVTAMASGLSIIAEPVDTATDQSAGVGVARRFSTHQIYSDPRILVACDADLYNEAELSAGIGGIEGAPREDVTAAMLARQYERFGSDFVQKLRGGFSIVLWDVRRKILMAAVDGFGIKRLVYSQTPKGLVIASRIDALIHSGLVGAEILPRAIPTIVNFSSNQSPDTILAGVQRLTPGTMLLRSNGEDRVRRYWDLEYGVGRGAGEEALCRELEAVLGESVRAHCAGVPEAARGAFLSGGTDSSTILGLMARLDKAPVQAFSIGFREHPFNELEYAEMAAERFHADWRTYLVTPQDCFDALPGIVKAFDEPFGNSSAVGTYFCARLAAEHGARVLLAGDGGDELFAGNEWYATDKLFEYYHGIPGALRRRVIEPLLRLAPESATTRFRNYVRRANLPPMERVLSFQFLATHAAGAVFHPDLLRQLDGYTFLDKATDLYTTAPAREHLDRLLYVDMKITIGDSDLPKVTCMTEMAGVQTRFPFLDRAVAEFSGRIPARLKVKGLNKRYLFKRAFRHLLPKEIIHKQKHGFGVPVADWLKTDPRLRELARDTLLSRQAHERGYFRRDFVEGLFEKHEADTSSYYGDILWTLLVLELWHCQSVAAAVKAAR